MTTDGRPEAPEDPSPAPTAAAKPRRKRKWDQPAESFISAGLAVLPPGIGGGIPGMAYPVANLLGGVLLPGSVPTASTIVPPLFQAPVLQQNVTALVQKLTQPKIQDEPIAREIVINDAEPTIRYRLTKRQTQEEIQKNTGAVVITRGKYRPPNGLPDSEKPLYLHISAGVHLKDTAERVKAVDNAASMVEEILKQGQVLQPGATALPTALNIEALANLTLITCVYLGFKPDASLNISDRVRGPNDQYINHIMNVTGATVMLRGQGSNHSESLLADEAEQPIHLFLTSNNSRSLEDARILAENLMDTISVECGVSRSSSSKVYNAVPPPQQLLAGVQGLTDTPKINTDTSTGSTFPIITSSSTTPCPPSAPTISAGCTTYPQRVNVQPQTNGVSYPVVSVSRGTSYSGYGGIYPQATPLQQVALALRQTPTPNSTFLAPHTFAACSSQKMNTTTSSSSNEEKDQRRQRRKFQELPVAASGSSPANQNLLQEQEFLNSGVALDDRTMHNVSSMPPPKKLIPLAGRAMPPPPPPPLFRNITPRSRDIPPSHARDIPPPPPKFAVPQYPPESKNNDSVPKKIGVEHVPDPLMKLMEYGEEDEDVLQERTEEISKNNSGISGLTKKPFWAI